MRYPAAERLEVTRKERCPELVVGVLLPRCPFASAQFRRHPGWADVLDRRREADA